MKVLFLTNIPSPYRIDFFNELGKHCDLTVWFEATSESNRAWEIDGLGRHFRYKFLKGRTFGLDKHWNRTIVRELNAEPFDAYIMGCYSSPTEIVAIHWLKLRGKRFILNSDGGFPGHDRLMQRKLKTYLISSADLWLSSGTNCTRYLLHYGASADRIREYPLSSAVWSEPDLQPLSQEEKTRFKQRNGLHGTVLLAVGQFIPRKGFDVLLRAFGKMQRDMPEADMSLVLVGGGPEKARYEELIKQERIEGVTIRDFMQKQELLPYWKTADLFAVPTRYDVWGLVFNEAAAFGLPIVTTSMAGAAFDLIRDGVNGFVIAPEDAGALADKCGELVRDPTLRELFGQAGRQMAELYSMDRMVSRHLSVLKDWLDAGRSGGDEHLHVGL